MVLQRKPIILKLIIKLYIKNNFMDPRLRTLGEMQRALGLEAEDLGLNLINVTY